MLSTGKKQNLGELYVEQTTTLSNVQRGCHILQCSNALVIDNGEPKAWYGSSLEADATRLQVRDWRGRWSTVCGVHGHKAAARPRRQCTGYPGPSVARRRGCLSEFHPSGEHLHRIPSCTFPPLPCMPAHGPSYVFVCLEHVHTSGGIIT